LCFGDPNDAFAGLVRYASSKVQVGTATANGSVTIFTGDAVESATFNPNYFTVNTRIAAAQGATVASANNLALGVDGNAFEITGSTQINLITSTNWKNGSILRLLFTTTCTVKNGQTTSGSNITLKLAGASDFSATAEDVLTLILSSVGGVQAWREVSRSVN
jgi:hypothetical protein